ncbi:MAG: hypothetical protein WBB08_00270 [Halobacteriota archaeon]
MEEFPGLAVEVTESAEKPVFFKEPTFLQSEVKSIRFSGNEPVKPYVDFQTLEGTVFDLIDKAEDFVLRNIRKSIMSLRKALSVTRSTLL